MASSTSSTARPEDSSSTATAAKLTGIDIQKALDILADRSHDHEHEHEHEHNHSTSSGCHSHQTDELKSMGQTIDLVQSPGPQNDAEDEGRKQEEEQRQKERAHQLLTELKCMSVKELLQTVLETQQQRVASYQGYNESLNKILQSANMTAYISSCAHTTAAFAVLSDTIRAIRTALVEIYSRNDLEKLLTNLQTREKEKLNLTAAYHLERIRERNENINKDSQAKTDNRISKLLSQGVTSLQEKLNAIVEEINECLEEIRYALIEEGEDDE